MKAKLIVNPHAGTDGAPDHLPMMNERLRERTGTLDIVLTTAEGDASRAARAAVDDGYDHLFVAGGDGTLNEVLNGVAQADGFDAVTLGVIPFGTGNDFAAAIGLPDDPEDAIRALLDSAPTPVDVGRLNGHYFLNVSAGGFIAEVSDAVSTELKTLTGRLAYLIGGAQVLLDYEPVGGRLDAASGRTVGARDVSLHAFAVCNSPLIGGGRLIAPDAVVDDGAFDVCLIRAMPTLEFVGLLTRVSDGEHVEDERVSYFRTRELELVFDRLVKVNTDGQVITADRCRYAILPRAIRVLGRAAGAVSART